MAKVMKIKEGDSLSVTVASGETLVLHRPRRLFENEQYRFVTLAVNPQGGATAEVSSSVTPWETIFKNPDAAAPVINKHPWPLGVIDPASPVKVDTFFGYLSAVFVAANGGDVIVEVGA